MNILAIDTSGYSMSICVKKEEKILGQIDIDNGLVHSVQLMPSIDMLFKSLDFDKKNLDLIAVSNGPGSFTGIRIGVATANAFSLGLEKPVVSVVALDALAMNAELFSGFVIPAIDAQRGNFYTGIYEFSDGQMLKLEDYSVKSHQEIEGFVEKADKPCLILGDMTRDFEKPEKAVKTPNDYNNIKARNVAILGREKFIKGQVDDFVKPFYMRKSQAEVEYEKKNTH